MATVAPVDVLDFWFGAPPGPRAARAEWFRKSEAFDALIRERFGALVEQALDETLPPAWHGDGTARLAQIVVLDQFTRNIFRGTARAFAGDALALALAQGMVDDGGDRLLLPLQRWFVYLPFEHAESPALQDRSVELFSALAAGAPAGAEAADLASALDYAQRHREVITRFGRYPHRNALLGRTSTAEEQAWLQLPGSGF